MIGKTVSHYKILEKLGEGGMGVVYKARDTKLDRFVALKFLTQTLTSDKESIERFQIEAKSAAALNHPNIVTIYEIGEHEEQLFIAMEFIEGKTLREEISEQRLAISEMRSIATQLCEGLGKAHDEGIVHRDIKPENILIDNDGLVKILDFGLAKLKGAGNLTIEMTTLGTAKYLSPEQATGEEVDLRSDIWSVGVILYEMLTGDVPFKGDYEQVVIYAIINEAPAVSSDPQRLIPEAFNRIIMKCLEKDPNQRYQNAQELTNDLHALEKKDSAKPTNEPSIVVLPFEDISPDKDNEYFSDGLTEEIISDLSQISSLRVISRTSSMILKGTTKNIRQIGKELDVQYVLEGSVRKSGDNVRITAQLIDAVNDTHLWAEKYNGTLDNVFDLQEKVSLEIKTALKVSVGGEEQEKLEKRYTDNSEAYDLYLKGLHLRRKMHDEGDIRMSIDYFEKAIKKDPEYALAYAGLSYAYLILAFYTPVKALEVYPAAKKTVLKALEIDDRLPEAYEALSLVTGYFEWNWHPSIQAGRKIIELNPSYPWGYFHLAHGLSNEGKYEESILLLEKAHQMDPLNPAFSRNLGLTYLRAGQLNTAIEILRRTIVMDSELPYTHLYIGYVYLIKQKYEEALAVMEKEKSALIEIIRPQLGVVYARMGNKEMALKILKKYDNKPEGEYTSYYSLATLCFALGKIDKGLDLLEKGYENHDMWMHQIKQDFLFDSVRSHPRFITLLKKMKLD